MKQKVIFILTTYNDGGIEKVFDIVAKSLINKDIEVYLFVIGSKIKKQPSKVHLINKFIDLWKLKQESYVINFSSDWKSSLLSALLSKHYVSWIHCNPCTMKTAKTHILNFGLLRKSKRIICVCEEQKNILITEYGFNNKIDVIYNCIDEEQIINMVNEKVNFDFKYIVMPARFDLGSKDFNTLLKAYSDLDSKIKEEYKLVLLGDGEDRKKISELIKKYEIENFIFMPGYSNNPYKWMKNAEIVLLISKTEGFPLTTIEAMFCETPLIISKFHTGAQEISDNGKNCVVVPVGNSQALSGAISNLIMDSNLRERYVRNAKKYINKFSQAEFEKKINILFEELLYE